MLELIACEIIVGETIGQQCGLAKSEAQAFAGDGIDSAGGVSDERDVVAIYVMQSSADRDRSALAGGDFGMFKARGECGEIGECGIEPQVRIRADEREADFIGAYGRDVDLRATFVRISVLRFIRPVQFHEIAPGRDTIMPPESEASFFFLVTVKASPEADA